MRTHEFASQKGVGGLMKHSSRCEASGCICTELWTDKATPVEFYLS